MHRFRAHHQQCSVQCRVASCALECKGTAASYLENFLVASQCEEIIISFSAFFFYLGKRKSNIEGIFAAFLVAFLKKIIGRPPRIVRHNAFCVQYKDVATALTKSDGLAVLGFLLQVGSVIGFLDAEHFVFYPRSVPPYGGH